MAIMGQQCDNMVSVILCRGTVTAPVICMFDFNGLMTCGIAEVYPIAIIFFGLQQGKKNIFKNNMFLASFGYILPQIPILVVNHQLIL